MQNTLYGYGQLRILKLEADCKVLINGHELKQDVEFFSPNCNSNLCLELIEGKNRFATRLTENNQPSNEDRETRLTENLKFLKLEPSDPNYEYHYNFLKSHDILGYIELTQNEATMQSGTNFKISRLLTSLLKSNFDQLSFNEHVDKNVINFSSGQENFVKKICNLSNQQNISLMLAGPRNVGKSSFNRFIINKLLNINKQVYFLDLDPGQSEFTLPSTLSLIKITKPLLGVPFCHNLESNKNEQIYSCYLGDLSPDQYKTNYLKIVQKLNKCFQDLSLSKSHLIVNTMGWIDGMGLAFLNDSMKIIQPSNVLFLGKEQDYKVDITLEYLNSLKSLINNTTKITTTKIEKSFEFDNSLDLCTQTTSSPKFNRTKYKAVKAVDHRDLFISSYILKNVRKVVCLPLNSVCFTIFNPNIKPQDCLKVFDQSMIAIFNTSPKPGKNDDQSQICKINSSLDNQNSINYSTTIQNKIDNDDPIISEIIDNLTKTSLNSKFVNFDQNDELNTSPKHDFNQQINYCSIFKPENFNCLGAAFVTKIDQNIHLIVPENVNKDEIKYLVKGRRGIDLSPKIMSYLNNGKMNFIEHFDRDDKILGSSHFIKRKKFFK